MPNKILDKLAVKVEGLMHSISFLQEKEAKRLKKRLRYFLLIYIPCIIAAAVIVIGETALAKSSSKTSDEETAKSSEGVTDWVEENSNDAIYQYIAGSGVTYETQSVPWGEETDYDVTNGTTFLSQQKDWFLENYFDIVTGNMDSDEADSNDVITNIIMTTLSTGSTFFTSGGVILLRYLIGAPFYSLEQFLAVLGPNFWPTSLYGLFLGRVGSGGTVDSNLFGFELVKGNIYGITGSIVYSILASVAGIGIALKLIFSLANAAWSSGSSEARRKLKESLTYNLGSILLLSVVPIATYFACYIRDHLLFEVLKVTEWASNLDFSNRTSINPLNGIATNGASYMIAASRSMGFNNGHSYNPFLERAFDFSSGTFMDTIMYAGSVGLLLIFMFMYISLALDTMLSFAFAPKSILSGKQAFMGWIQHMVANILTPVMDMLILIVPLLVSSVAREDSASYVGVGLIQLVICFSYFPLRSSIRSKLGLQSAEKSEGMGMGSLMMSMGALRALTNGAFQLVSAGSGAIKDMAAATAGANAAETEAMNQLSDAENMDHTLDELSTKMQSVNGAEESRQDMAGLDFREEDANMNKKEEDLLNHAPGESEALNDDELVSMQERLRANQSEDREEDPLNEMQQEPEGISAISETDPAKEKRMGQDNVLLEETEDRQEETLADANMRQAVESSRIADQALKQKEENQKLANFYDQKAAHLNTLVAKGKAGTLSASERSQFPGTRKAQAIAAEYKELSREARTKAMENDTIHKQAVAVSNRLRQRMGLGGSGTISASELNAYRAVQQSANLGNFTSPLIGRSLSPQQQVKFYLQAREKAGASLAAGIGTTTALAGIVGAGSIFMPNAVKAAGAGMVAGVGGGVIRSVRRSGENASVPVVSPVAPYPQEAARVNVAAHIPLELEYATENAVPTTDGTGILDTGQRIYPRPQQTRYDICVEAMEHLYQQLSDDSNIERFLAAQQSVAQGINLSPVIAQTYAQFDRKAKETGMEPKRIQISITGKDNVEQVIDVGASMKNPVFAEQVCLYLAYSNAAKKACLENDLAFGLQETDIRAALRNQMLPIIRQQTGMEQAADADINKQIRQIQNAITGLRDAYKNGNLILDRAADAVLIEQLQTITEEML